MIMMKKVLAAALLAGLAAAPPASAEQPAGIRSYAAAQAISHSFGSKRAVGYFAQASGSCALTMFLTESEDAYVAPSAARIKLTVKPGESAELASVEGSGLEVRCSKDAASVEVRPTVITAVTATN